MADIYAYFDIHHYLQQEFCERKARNPRYSYRALAAKLAMNSGTLARIMHGKRNVSKRLAPLLAACFGLREKEASYLERLAALGRARSEVERIALYRELVTLRGGASKHLAPDHHEFYEQWYYTALRELLQFYPFKGNYHELAALFNPPLSVHQARKAVKVLLEQGLLEQRADGYAVVHPTITSGDSWQGMAIHRYQQATLELAQQALQRIAQPERDFSTMTMSYSAKGMERARAVLKKTREELSRIEQTDSNRNRVYQINMQLFPLSHPYQDSVP